MLEYFATCMSGLEHQLDRELRGLGAKRCRPLNGGVAFFGEPEAMYRVCLWSRLASRISLVVGRVRAVDADILYRGVEDIPWEEIIAEGKTIVVHAHGTNEELRNSHFTELRVKDAIVDRLYRKRGVRPDVDAKAPDCSIVVRLRQDKASISLDMTGDSLYRRTYLLEDRASSQAHECALAASICTMAGIGPRFTYPVFDPCCGQGHVLVEAAQMMTDCAPGLTRSAWGFAGWAAHDEETWNSLLDEADQRLEAGLARFEDAATRPLIVGVASSPRSLAWCQEHAKRAGMAKYVAMMSVEPKNLAAYFQALRDRFDAADKTPVIVSATSTQTQNAAGEVTPAQVAVDACRILGAGRQVLAGEELRGLFGVEPAQQIEVRIGNLTTKVMCFTDAPTELEEITIPDSFGGADHKVKVRDASSVSFADRLRKVARERRKWAKREKISCYRVYDSDMPEYAAAIDIYNGAGPNEGEKYLHIAEYAAPHTVDPADAARRFDDLVTLAPIVLGIPKEHVFCKVRRRDRGGSQYAQNNDNYIIYTEEDGLYIEADLNGYLDTGIFLDHRVTREMVGSMADDCRFLNLFAYTGTATLHAAAGGANTTTTVDLSTTYLDWAARNMHVNGFDGPQHSFERSDVMQWIDQARGQKLRFDLIFVDPPTFSNSKSMGTHTWDVQRDHAELLIGVSRLLAKGGQAVFSCNLRTFKPDYEKLESFGVELTDITAQTIPHDFERNPRIHKCYLVRRVFKDGE